jgi:beta-glucanase (GH16 family)
MKKILSTTALIFFIAIAANAAPPADYRLVWQDEFKGTSLDLSKWKPDTYKRDAAKLTTDAISIGKDGLRIRTSTENGVNYTGFMTSKGLFSATYGYFESRIRFRGVPGQLCGFWLQPEKLGKVIGNPQQSGVETDIVEHRINDKDDKDIGNLAAFNLHWDGYGANHKHIGGTWLSPSSLNETWHTYALLWTLDGYVFYVDEIERWHSNVAVSQVPQDVRLTCEIEGKTLWSGRIPDGGYGPRQTTPYGMDVNWVRVWQKSK